MPTHIHKPISSLTEDTRQKYNQVARIYTLVNPIEETMIGVRKVRRNLLSGVKGHVLEIACGTGVNFSYYGPDCDITAMDLSPAMLDIARVKAEKSGLSVKFLAGDVHSLHFPDRSFDVVISSMSLCTFSDPIAALREMARVCRADGRILLLEHGRSDREWMGRWQDKNAESHARRLNCVWNRKPLELVAEAGLITVSCSRHRLGMLHVIVAKPGNA